MAGELSQAEWARLEAAIEDGAIADSNPDRALMQGAERGWLAARDYGRERERALRDALKGIEDFVERVEKWSSLPDEIHEILDTIRCSLAGAQPDHGPGEPSEDAQAVSEASTILRKIVLKRDPRVQELEPVSLSVRIAAESWLAAYEPSTALVGESNG
jgi:hypothetical protein